jgi:hypothetical protein
MIFDEPTIACSFGAFFQAASSYRVPYKTGAETSFNTFRFNIDTAHFGVSIEPKQTKHEPKQAESRKFV